MRQLILNEHQMIHKLERRTKHFITEQTFENLMVQYYRRGTYTCCLIILDNYIVGVGMTKRLRYDRENQDIAKNVAFSKAARDYLIGENYILMEKIIC